MDRINAKSLGAILDEYVQDRGLQDRFQSLDLVSIWQLVVNRKEAEATRKLNFRDGVLQVYVSSSLIRNSLYYRRPQIIEAMNAILGSEKIKSLTIR